MPHLNQLNQLNNHPIQRPQFCQLMLKGDDASQFLQGQLTLNVHKLGLSYLPTAISNLKGRIAFGLWIKKYEDDDGLLYELVVSADCADDLVAHIKKYAAFSKVSLTPAQPIYPCLIDGEPTFTTNANIADMTDIDAWMTTSIATGNYWITQATAGQFQPQELRLHQRGGVDYDKGCYLGQEVIARLYFKAAPKAYLHRVKGDYRHLQANATALPMAGEPLADGINVVNIISCADDDLAFEALVVARPQAIEDIKSSAQAFKVLDLPAHLQGDVARSV